MIHTERKRNILNVVDILVSLNFMHMKMCSSFFLPLLRWKIHHRSAFCFVLLQISISRNFLPTSNWTLLWFLVASYSFKYNFIPLWLISFQRIIFCFIYKPGKWKIHKKENSRDGEILHGETFVKSFSGRPYVRTAFNDAFQTVTSSEIDVKMTLEDWSARSREKIEKSSWNKFSSPEGTI